MTRATEQRLLELRAQAERIGVIDAKGVRPAGAPFPVATTVTGYYGLPLLKPPVWTWEVPAYFFVGGAAGAAAMLGCVAQHTGASPELVRDARWIAAGGAAASTPLLIGDLGRPERFLNMLRVFKPQSPMSVGAWTLAAFATASSAAAFAEELRRKTDLPVTLIGDAAAMLSGATGLVMATYTGVLIGATSIPVWAKHAAVLPIHFGASALASAVALLELRGHDERALTLLGFVAAAFETAMGLLVKSGGAPATLHVGGVFSGPLPLALRVLGIKSKRARKAAAASALLGSLLTRIAWVEAGRSSARGSHTGTR